MTKTFTYNQIIELFNRYGLPLSEKQLYLIQSLSRQEMDKSEVKEETKRNRKVAKGFKW